MFFFRGNVTSPSTASSAENQIFNHISRFLGSLEFAHLQFMVKTNQAIFRPQHHHNIIMIIVNLTCWPFIKINHKITTTIVASSPVSLAAKCMHMPRLLHVPLVPLHVSRDVLALLLSPSCSLSCCWSGDCYLADENVFPAFSLPLKRHSVRHLHILHHLLIVCNYHLHHQFSFSGLFVCFPSSLRVSTAMRSFEQRESLIIKIDIKFLNWIIFLNAHTASRH